MNRWIVRLALATCLVAPGASAEEPDHGVHEALRRILAEVQTAVNSGRYDAMLPVLDERIAATSMTQEVMSSRADVAKYFQDWFGPAGYMKRMDMKLTADTLTELSPDKSWGLVRGTGAEFYEAKDGDTFDFRTRWTAVVVRNPDNEWRLRAIHFGTNNLDNPVLHKVQRTLTRYAILWSAGALVVGLAVGWWLGRRRGRGA